MWDLLYLLWAQYPGSVCPSSLLWFHIFRQSRQPRLPCQPRSLELPVTTFSSSYSLTVYWFRANAILLGFFLFNLNAACAYECAGKIVREFDECQILHLKFQEAMPPAVGTSTLKYSSANAESCSSMFSIWSSFGIICALVALDSTALLHLFTCGTCDPLM